MATYGMVIDVSRCTGCYNCFLACRDEHAGNGHLPVAAAQPDSGHKWMDVQEHERGKFPRVRVDYVPLPCQHCAVATCISMSPDGSVYRRDDGIVIIDPEMAVGKREIVSSCPHRAIFWNEALAVPQKCTLCAHLIDQGGKQPRCVEACPTQALVFGDLDDPDSEISNLRRSGAVENLHPEYGLQPLVGYIALPKRFIVGEVAFADLPDAPARGVELRLEGGARSLHMAADAFGDFAFEELEADVDYTLHVAAQQYRPRQFHVGRKRDADLGTIVLQPG